MATKPASNQKSPEVKVCQIGGFYIFDANKKAQQHLNLLFSRRQVSKEYHAIVLGKHNFNIALRQKIFFTCFFDVPVQVDDRRWLIN